MIQCSFCSETVPETRYCLNCNTNLGAVEIPRRDPSPTSRLSELASEADHESVSFDALRSRYDQYDRPLGGYLLADERPERIIDVGTVTVDGYTGDAWTIRPGFTRHGHAVLTDRRLVVVSPSDTGDQLAAVDYAAAVRVDAESTWLKDSLTVELADGSSVTLDVVGESGDELDAIADRLRRRVRELDSPESRAAALTEALDDVVADADDAETALREAAALFAEHDDTVYDHLVGEADSADDLSALLSTVRNDPTPGGESAAPADEAAGNAAPAGGATGAAASSDTTSDGAAAGAPVPRGDDGTGVPLPTDRLDPRPIRQRVERTLQNSDPKEAGKWAIGAGIAGFSVAVSLPFSTAAGLGAIALGGAATGAYASANPDSVPAQIDPIEMAIGAKTRGRRWKQGSAPGGAAVGSAIGAAEHVAGEIDSREYAEWYANVDPELILRGAELGARTAESSSDFDDTTAAAVVGGGFGLAYGYSGFDDEGDEITALLDEDLRERLPTTDEGDADREEDGGADGRSADDGAAGTDDGTGGESVDVVDVEGTEVEDADETEVEDAAGAESDGADGDATGTADGDDTAQ